MANLNLFTEQFDNSWWAKFDGATVTADTHPAPAFAGALANGADTATDTSNTGNASVYGTYVSIPNDSASYVFSIYVRKDAVSTRFPEIHCQFTGGTQVFGAISFNTVNGTVVPAHGNAVDASGSVDVDSDWWRVWFSRANNNTGNTAVRMALFICPASSLGGSPNGTLMGSAVVWGANITPGGALQSYEPDPYYQIGSTWTTLDTLGGMASSYSDLTAQPQIAYEYRVLATNNAGNTPSNLVVATATGAVVIPSSRRVLHHYRRDVFRRRVA